MKPRSLAGLCSAVVVSALVSVVAPGPGAVADPPGATYSVVGQPGASSSTLLTRCSAANARFNQNNFGGGFAVDGPTGVFVTPGGRLFALDDGGQRVLSWPNADAMTSCQAADEVIGSPDVLNGPEGLTVGPDGSVYVADTLQHVVEIFTPDGNGDYPAAPQVVLGQPFVQGSAGDQLVYPRGLALDDDGRLFVADDYNNRVQIFAPPFVSGQFAADAIHAGANGGLANPKDLAFADGSLFVADFNDSRVLRFPGPFDNPAATYTADATFTGVGQPVNLTVSADHTLYVTDGGTGGQPSVKAYPGATTGGDQAAAASEYTFGGLLTGPSPDNGNQAEPLGVAVTPAGRLIVADYAGYRLVVETPPSVTPPGLAVVSTDLPDAYVQAPVKARLTATGGTGTLTWHATTALPPGLKLSTSGQVTGNPSGIGTFSFGVSVTDRSKPAKTGAGTITLEVIPMGIQLNGPAALIGKNYRAKWTHSGGKGTISYSLFAGSLPNGLKMSKQGVITGTPSVPGTFTFEVFASDKATPQNLAQWTTSLTVQPFSFSYATNPLFASVGQRVTMKPTLVGGKTPIKWSVSNGTLPPGLKLNATNGQITGTVTAPGSFDFRVNAFDHTLVPGPNSHSEDVAISVL